LAGRGLAAVATRLSFDVMLFVVRQGWLDLGPLAEEQRLLQPKLGHLPRIFVPIIEIIQA
jgi:hypothetical protein